MEISLNKVVAISYQVRSEDGVLLDEMPKEQPLTYIHGHNNLVQGLEEALVGKKAGDHLEITVTADKAYGEHNENLVQRVPADVFEGVDELEVGMRFIADTDQGPLPVVITEVDGDEVVVDGNHMLAGQSLHFVVDVINVREASADEIEQEHTEATHAGGCCGKDGCSDHH